MTDLELCDRPIHELHTLRQQGVVSTEDIANSVLKRIEETESQVKAYLLLTTENLLESARNTDKQLKKGQLSSPLAGMPIALKDIFITEGIKTTCGSKILANFIPSYDATVTKRLKEAGMSLTGKTNLDEFAMGSSTKNSGFGPSYNPWNLRCSPGGSSGGSAAAVAAGEALASIGTDTGGSVRQPCAWTGLVGLKPTYGLISRYGMVAFASSLDTAGILTHDVRDSALLLKALAGHDPLDSTSAQEPIPDYPALLDNASLKGKRIGLVRELESELEGTTEIRDNFRQSVKLLKSLGAEVRQISIPNWKFAFSIYHLIAPAEASSNLGRYDGIRYGVRATDKLGLRELYCHTRKAGLGKEVKLRIMLGTFALSAGFHNDYYKKASALRQSLRNDFAKAFLEVELLATPTTPTEAIYLSTSLTPLQTYNHDIFTLPLNLAELPGITIPSGFSSSKLPFGLQLIGRHFQEGELLKAAHIFCETAAFHRQRPTRKNTSPASSSSSSSSPS